jgi:hypothetical protein
MADELIIDTERLKIQEAEMAEPADDVELTEELADTAIIEQLFDEYHNTVQELFTDAVEAAISGTHVQSYLELRNFGDDVMQIAAELRVELIARLAKRTEELNLEEAATGRGWVYEASEEAQLQASATEAPEEN